MFVYYYFYRAAYVEFETAEGANQAKRLNESLFKGRQITVMPKRKNIPGRGASRGGGRGRAMHQAMAALQMMLGGRGRGGRGRGRGRGGFRPY
jgi:polyadenylate-binding protein 2